MSGAHVQQGQVIGYVGCTGNCTGPHLHFETRVGGVARDPSQYLSGASMPGAAATATKASGRAPRVRAQFDIGEGSTQTASQTGSASAEAPRPPVSRERDPGRAAGGGEQSEDTLTGGEIAAEVAPPGTVSGQAPPGGKDRQARCRRSRDPTGTVSPTDATGTKPTAPAVTATVPAPPPTRRRRPRRPATTRLRPPHRHDARPGEPTTTDRGGDPGSPDRSGDPGRPGGSRPAVAPRPPRRRLRGRATAPAPAPAPTRRPPATTAPAPDATVTAGASTVTAVT